MTGRGCWTNVGGTYVMGSNPAMGYYAYRSGDLVGSEAALDPTVIDYQAVTYGVRQIQARLNEFLHIVLVVDGLFGPATAAAAKTFQQNNGLTVDSIVGPATTRAMFKPIVSRYEQMYGIPGHLLYGLIDVESSFDPGGVGSAGPDKFLAQFYLDGTLTWWNKPLDGRAELQLTVANFWPAQVSIEQAARRMAYYFKLYAAKPDLVQQCAILQHNAPGWAQTLYNTGLYPNLMSKAYVDAVYARAAKF